MAFPKTVLRTRLPLLLRQVQGWPSERQASTTAAWRRGIGHLHDS